LRQNSEHCHCAEEGILPASYLGVWHEQAYGFRSVSLRYFNATGADLQAEIGEDPGTSRLIPRALETAAGRCSELVIYGNNYPTRDGTAIRDYVHVEDIVEAHLIALNYLRAGGQSAVLNLGTGTGYSVSEIVKAVEIITGENIRKRFAPRRLGDPPELVADPTKANAVLGWRPTRSDLKTILQSAWDWHTKSGAPPV
jgi:UDP-glucose 4-epimerase